MVVVAGMTVLQLIEAADGAATFVKTAIDITNEIHKAGGGPATALTVSHIERLRIAASAGVGSGNDATAPWMPATR
jgi:hypothetical protein